MDFLSKQQAYSYQSLDQSYESLREKNRALEQLMKEMDFSTSSRASMGQGPLSIRERLSKKSIGPSDEVRFGPKGEKKSWADSLYDTIVSFGCFGPRKIKEEEEPRSSQIRKRKV